MQNFLTEKEVAKQIKVSLASLRRWRLVQRGPRFVKVGALVRYRPEDLDEWMKTLPAGGTAPQQQGVHLEDGIGMTATMSNSLAHIILIVSDNSVDEKTAASKAASLMGKRSYKARVERFGIERLQEIARENGKLGGRPKGSGKKQSKARKD